MSSGNRHARVEIVRGRVSPEIEQGLRALWSGHQGPTGPDADRRLREVVCVVRDGTEVVGASSVYAAAVAPLGGRRLWVMRHLLLDTAGESTLALIRETFRALDREPHPEAQTIGLAVPLDREARRWLPREAQWDDPRAVHAGFLPDGRQLRLAYFSDQVSAAAPPGPEGQSVAGDGYRIVPFGPDGTVSAAEVIELWTREGALSPEEAQRRVSELCFVAVDPDGRPAGMSTAYLQFNADVQADMWYVRAFVAAAHRRSSLSVSLVLTGRDHLVHRYVRGEDPRGLGVILEVENENLKRALPKAVWHTTDFVLIGETARGAHVRVHYFPGALAPEPSAAAAGQGSA
jgi:hypothetical protein